MIKITKLNVPMMLLAFTNSTRESWPMCGVFELKYFPYRHNLDFPLVELFVIDGFKHSTKSIRLTWVKVVH